LTDTGGVTTANINGLGYNFYRLRDCHGPYEHQPGSRDTGGSWTMCADECSALPSCPLSDTPQSGCCDSFVFQSGESPDCRFKQLDRSRVVDSGLTILNCRHPGNGHSGDDADHNDWDFYERLFGVSCVTCPANTQTTLAGNTMTACLCDEGYVNSNNATYTVHSNTACSTGNGAIDYATADGVAELQS